MASKRKPSNNVRAPGQLPARAPKEKAGQSFFSDQVLKFSTELVNWVYDYRVPVLLTVVGIFVVAGARTFWDSHTDKKNYEGAAHLYDAVSSLPDYDNSLARRGIDISGAERTDQEIKKREEKFLTAANSLEKVAEDYSSVTSGTIALLERARLLEKAEKPDDAIATYKKVLEDKSLEPLFAYTALNGVGQLLRENKKYAEASKYYKQASTELSGVWQELGTVELGKTQELQEDYKAAIGTYEEFLKKYPNSGQADDVESRLAYVKRVAGVSSTTGVAPDSGKEASGAASGGVSDDKGGSDDASSGAGAGISEKSAPDAGPEDKSSDSSSGEGEE